MEIGMWFRGIIIGVTLTAPQSVAVAQTGAAATATAFAVVDASGRILPIRPTAPQVEVIDRSNGIASPCGNMRALSAEAARALVARIATQESFYPDFVLSVAKIESHYVSTALSDKGAYGLMQLLPETAQRFKVDLCDPGSNVRGGVRFLRLLHERYRNPFFILAAYNAGEDAVQKSRGVPPYPQTVRFIADVMNDFYTWPNPRQLAEPYTGNTASSAPGIIEPAGAQTTHPLAAANEKPATAQWSNGFVMHVD
jgi:soluble lytic murein transglycosylase-like protein